MMEESRLALDTAPVFEHIFRLAKENAILLMDINGRVRRVSGSFTECFGYAESELSGQHFSCLFTLEDQLAGLPQKELEKVMLSGQGSDNNYIVHKNKTKTWVSGESVLIQAAGGEQSIVKIIQNIDVQKTREKELEKLDDFNARILAFIEDVVIVIDQDGQVTRANHAFREIFGAGIEADKSILDNLLQLNPPLKNVLDQSLVSLTSPLSEELELALFHGEKRIFNLFCKLLSKEDHASSLLVVMHDVTMAREMEKQREDLIGFVAHELRNPLSNIVLCNELLDLSLAEGRISEAREFLARSQNNVLRLNKMISELYDATKVESGNLPIERKLFNMKEMIGEAVDTIKALQPLYKINVIHAIDINVYGDRYRLMQVVINYLSNGIKYADGSNEIELSVQEDSDSVSVAVKDKGLGIAKEHLPFIFNRFFRVEKTKNLEGIGLGLFLCKRIIQAHHGRVWVESEEGRGSIFYFSIPK